MSVPSYDSEVVPALSIRKRKIICNLFWDYPESGLLSGTLQGSTVTKSIFSARYETFRRELIAAREAAGLTQAQLAAKLSRPQSFVSKYERGERRLDVIEFLEVAEALGIDPVRFTRKMLQGSESRKR